MCNSTPSPPQASLELARLRVQVGNKTLLDLDAIRVISAECAYNATALAARLGISIRQLQRLFARQIGRSPRAWLREERMQAAHRLLHRSTTIKEVAMSLSFRQESHFSRDFRSHFGYTPSTVVKSTRPREEPRPSHCDPLVARCN
jgi:AraC-like DNA-binding protein